VQNFKLLLSSLQVYDGLTILQVWTAAINPNSPYIHHTSSESLNSRRYNSTQGRMLIRPHTPVRHLSMRLLPLSSTIPRYVMILQGIIGIITAISHLASIHFTARCRSVFPSCIRKHLFSHREPDSSTFTSTKSTSRLVACGNFPDVYSKLNFALGCL